MFGQECHSPRASGARLRIIFRRPFEVAAVPLAAHRLDEEL
jgi:hypothetical protein